MDSGEQLCRAVGIKKGVVYVQTELSWGDRGDPGERAAKKAGTATERVRRALYGCR